MARPSLAEYAARLSVATIAECRLLLDELTGDDRIGAIRLLDRTSRRLECLEAERRRTSELMRLQRTLHDQGHSIIAGADEVGRGALAGPVTACAVVLPHDARIAGLDDSKRLSPHARESLAARIEAAAVALAVAHVPAHIIDSIGIVPATRTAFEKSLAALGVVPDHVITDGHPVGVPYPETAVIRGDSSVACVAAASIVAKVARDRLMAGLAASYAGYGLEINKGYGTTEHLTSIAEMGVTPIHRRSFAPCSGPMTLF